MKQQVTQLSLDCACARLFPPKWAELVQLPRARGRLPVVYTSSRARACMRELAARLAVVYMLF